ncbi:hypothetical protein B0H12DRAFT_1135217 [Mycena haematopus]|nr:hypothetical protein B0H12DRAFT_1135217 [Mycena haematopus]
MNLLRVRGTRRIPGIPQAHNSRRIEHTRRSSTKSSSESEVQPSSKEPGRPRRILSTLTPSLLTPNDFLDLAGRQRLRVSFPNPEKGLGGFQLYYERLTVPIPKRIFMPFPDDARGFLYFGLQPGLPIHAASLRFRCTPDHLPNSFDAGYDLKLHGLPWQLLLLQPAVIDSPIVREQLLREGHATIRTFASIRAHIGERSRIPPPLMLFRLSQLFPVHFSRPLTLDVFGLDRVHQIVLGHIFANHQGSSLYYPFNGVSFSNNFCSVLLCDPCVFVQAPPSRASSVLIRI